MKSSTYKRLSILTLLAMGIMTGPILWGSDQGVRTMFNAPLLWIPSDSASRREYERFLAQFKSHEIVLLSWPGCTVDDPRSQELASDLISARDELVAQGEPPLFFQVLSGYTVLRELQEEPAELSRNQALRRMMGTLVGPDGETSCVAVALTTEGSLRRRETVASLLEFTKRVTGFDRQELRIAGPAIDGIATDDESSRSLRRYSLPAILISLLLCCLCLRSIWLTLPILAVGALGQSAMLATVYYLGITMNAVLIVLPALIFVLTVSAGVHLVNYFYDEIRGGGFEGATTRSLLKARGPCALAAVTTAVGLASLTVSSVEPVRQFGAAAGCGVLVTVLLLFLLLPGAMEVRRWIPRRQQRLSHSDDPSEHRMPSTVWQGVANLVCAHSGWIVVASVLLLVGCGAGLVYLRSSVNVVSLLAAENRAVQDFHWFEEHLGPLVSLEVVLHFDDSNQLDPLQRLELVRAAQAAISQIESLGGTLSAASFFPTIPQAGGLRNTARRVVLRHRVEDHRDDLVAAQFLSCNDGNESWRITARMLVREKVNYEGMQALVRERVSGLIDQQLRGGDRGVLMTCTGVTSVVYEVEKTLLADLFRSFITALCCVTFIMMIALRSIPAGLLAMIPNVFPTLVLFGAMGWLDRPVDIGTMMTASVALGMAVDGTFHFLKWFRHEVHQGADRREAIGHAYEHCGKALTQTTAICALGLLVFAFSGFLPARHFSIVLLLLLLAALVGDLAVLPAILASRLGTLFLRRQDTPAPAC